MYTIITVDTNKEGHQEWKTDHRLLKNALIAANKLARQLDKKGTPLRVLVDAGDGWYDLDGLWRPVDAHWVKIEGSWVKVEDEDSPL